MLKSYADVTSHIIYNDSDFKQALEFISSQELLGFDIETDGVNPRKNRVIGIGVSHMTHGFYLPIFEYDIDTEGLIELWPRSKVLEFLHALNGKKLLAWNGAFEGSFCNYNLGWDFTSNFYSDQMLMLHTINENLQNYGLKENAEYEFGPMATEAQRQMFASIEANGGTEKEYYKASTKSIGHYCVWDCALTYAFHHRDSTRLAKERLTKFFFEDEVMPFARKVLIPMINNGIPVDMPLLEKNLAEISADIERLESEIQSEIAPLLDDFTDWFLNKDYPPQASGQFAQAAIQVLGAQNLPQTKSGSYSLAAKAIDNLPFGILKSWLKGQSKLPASTVRKVQLLMHGNKPMFNLLSKDHLKRLFFQKLKETPISTTDKGAPQVDWRFLEKMAEKYGWAKKLITYNSLNKLKGTYFERVYKEQEDGKFYPQYFMHRTTSGRQSGDFQQLPRPVSAKDEPDELVRKYTNVIRALFIAAPNYKYLDADYNSLEVVVFADDAGDEALLDIIRNDKDFYSEVAIGVNNLQDKYSSDKNASNFLKIHEPELRQAAKAYALGIRYGEESFKLHHELKISQDEAEAIIQKYYAAYPKLKQKMDYYKDMVRTKGYVRSKAGRKRRSPKAIALHQKHGEELMDSLVMWKKYNKDVEKYADVKRERKEMKAMLNNALNFPIQSFAASIVSRAAIALADWLQANCPEARIIALVHDQIIVHCPDSKLDLVIPNMKRIMENTTQLSVPLIADPQVSTNLRDGH